MLNRMSAINVMNSLITIHVKLTAERSHRSQKFGRSSGGCHARKSCRMRST